MPLQIIQFKFILEDYIILIIYMSSQEEEEEDQEEIVFEEEEVLWAKIRGYPWWPAFVDKVHQQQIDDETQYTVFFFGDNTHSQLGASKLRKFYQNYSEFYQKAKTHRKLLLAILKAEQKLKQNDQNVEIFENLRKSLKSTRGRGVNRTESKIGSEDQDQNVISNLPDLKKSKTYANDRDNIKKKKQKQKQKDIIKMEEESEDRQQNLPQNHQQQHLEQQNRFAQIKKKDKKEIRGGKGKRQLRSNLIKNQEQIFEDSSHENVSPSAFRKKEIKDKNKNNQVSQNDSKDKKLKSLRESQEENEKMEIQNRKKDRLFQIKQKISENRVHTVRKRGRPKKIVDEDSEQNQIQKQIEKLKEQKFKKVEIEKKVVIGKSLRDKRLRGKIGMKQDGMMRRYEESKKELSKSNEEILERIKGLLPHRDELIHYLKEIAITTDNVKEILDLDVSTVLQEEGDVTPDVVQLLELLKSAILSKYFPDDLKARKKFQRLAKKRITNIHKMDSEQEDEEEKSIIIQETEESKEIRKKTRIKIQKFLKSYPDIESKAKEIALKIESYFQKADKGIGQGYKKMAFKVLRNLKFKEEDFNEILKKLETNFYEKEPII